MTKAGVFMTKHVAGFILFAFIFTTAVFISAVTRPSNVVPVTDSKEHCDKKKKKKRKKRHHRRHHERRELTGAGLQQVVFNKESGLLSATFSKYDDPRKGNDIELHFFAKDQYGTRFLKTESLAYTGNKVNYLKEMDWLGRIDKDQNIYVITGSNDITDDWSFPPEFNSYAAVPVLMSGE